MSKINGTTTPPNPNTDESVEPLHVGDLGDATDARLLCCALGASGGAYDDGAETI